MTLATKDSQPEVATLPSTQEEVDRPEATGVSIDEPFLQIPDGPFLRHFLKLAVLVGIWFKGLFNGANYITSLHPHRVDVAMQWELSTIPFVPQFTLIYSSIYFSMAMLPFALRTRRELNAMARALAVTIAFATVAFLLVPTQPSYAPLPAHYPLDWLHEVTKRLALEHNLAPSLHVAMSWLILRTIATKAPLPAAVLLLLWAGGIALATLLTHQHHVIDVMTGWLLSEVMYRYVYLPRARPGGDNDQDAKQATQPA